MRTAQTVLTVIQERGKQHKPIERVYKLLFNRDFYLNAYAKLYPNNGAMTKGVTDETVDGMSIQKIDRMIEDVTQRCRKFRFGKEPVGSSREIYPNTSIRLTTMFS